MFGCVYVRQETLEIALLSSLSRGEIFVTKRQDVVNDKKRESRKKTRLVSPQSLSLSTH